MYRMFYHHDVAEETTVLPCSSFLNHGFGAKIQPIPNAVPVVSYFQLFIKLPSLQTTKMWNSEPWLNTDIVHPHEYTSMTSYIDRSRHGRRNWGACAPPQLFCQVKFFLTQYALLSRKLAHKMFIFHQIFRLSSLANQDTS